MRARSHRGERTSDVRSSGSGSPDSVWSLPHPSICLQSWWFHFSLQLSRIPQCGDTILSLICLLRVFRTIPLPSYCEWSGYEHGTGLSRRLWSRVSRSFGRPHGVVALGHRRIHGCFRIHMISWAVALTNSEWGFPFPTPSSACVLSCFCGHSDWTLMTSQSGFNLPSHNCLGYWTLSDTS